MYSCDKGFNEEVYITNYCSDSISIKFVFAINHPSEEFNVAAYDSYLYYRHSMPYGEHPKNFINNRFENITVTKKGMISKINYVNLEKWTFIEYEENKFRSYLTINPEDFE
jgi:hypothetical protein